MTKPPERIRTELCHNCRWWDPHDKDILNRENEYGLCHFGAPVVKAPHWPQTLRDDWCSRHKPMLPKVKPGESSDKSES